MEILTVVTILAEVLGMYILILVVFPNLLEYFGLKNTGLVLTIALHFLGGYLMFFS
jgi:hypothetical protein